MQNLSVRRTQETLKERRERSLLTRLHPTTAGGIKTTVRINLIVVEALATLALGRMKCYTAIIPRCA